MLGRNGKFVTDVEKVRLELATFENFRHVGKVRFDKYEPQSPPEPDIIAWRGDHSFGIEITNFHRQEEKRKESEEDKTLQAALDLYNRNNGPQLLFHLMWAPHFKIIRKDRERLAEKIAALALRYAPVPESWTNLDWHHFDSDLMCAIDHISMYGMRASMSGHWSAARGAAVQEWNATTLQGVIDRKKEKPKQYLNSYEQIWLLVVSEFGTPSSWMEASEDIRNARFVSPFDRTFLLSSFPLEVIQLRLT